MSVVTVVKAVDLPCLIEAAPSHVRGRWAFVTGKSDREFGAKLPRSAAAPAHLFATDRDPRTRHS